MDIYDRSIGPRAGAAIDDYLRSRPHAAAAINPRWQPIGRRVLLASGGSTQVTFRPKGSPYLALAVSASFHGTGTDHPGLVRVEMRGASKAGYILGDETEPCPLPALLTTAQGPTPIAPGRILLTDEEYVATLQSDVLAGPALVTITFHGCYLGG